MLTVWMKVTRILLIYITMHLPMGIGVILFFIDDTRDILDHFGKNNFWKKAFSSYAHVRLGAEIGLWHRTLSDLFLFLFSRSAEYRKTVFDKYSMIYNVVYACENRFLLFPDNFFLRKYDKYLACILYGFNFTDIVGGLAHQIKWGKKSWDVKVKPFIVDVPLRVRVTIDPFKKARTKSQGKIQRNNVLILPIYKENIYITRHKIFFYKTSYCVDITSRLFYEIMQKWLYLQKYKQGTLIKLVTLFQH